MENAGPRPSGWPGVLVTVAGSTLFELGAVLCGHNAQKQAQDGQRTASQGNASQDDLCANLLTWQYVY